jgi:hypothetical protein
MRRPPRPQASLLHAAAIVLLTLCAYAGSFDGAFVSDDIRTIRDNEIIRGLDGAHVAQMFSTFDGANYMPLTVLSLAVDYQLWGLEPRGFHVTNLLMHIGCALLVYLILMRLGLPAGVSCLTALLWAVHPLQVESVAWISERKNVLSGLFFFATFYLYLDYSNRDADSAHRPRPGTYAAIVALFTCAVLSKLNTMVLPALFLAYETAFRGRWRPRDFLVAAPLFAIGGLVAWYNLAGNPIHGSHWHGGSVLATWLTSSVVFFDYLRLLILPIDLQSWYDVTIRGSLADPIALLCVVGIVLIAATTLWSIRARRPEAFWILWFVITLLPMLNILVPSRSLMQDRYMYLSMLGPLALAATMLNARAPSGHARRGLAAASSVVVAVCMLLSYRQVEMWDSPMAEWSHGAVRRAWPPLDSLPPLFTEKVAHLRQVVADDPSAAIARNNLGTLYFTAGRIPEALAEFQAANQLAPGTAAILINVGLAHQRLRQYPEAEGALERGVARAPYSMIGRLNLARVYRARGNVHGARRELDACEGLRPDWVFRRERAQLERLETR